MNNKYSGTYDQAVEQLSEKMLDSKYDGASLKPEAEYWMKQYGPEFMTAVMRTVFDELGRLDENTKS